MTQFMTGFTQMTAAEYHADPCRVPSLSSSIAHVIDSESPRHAWTRHPRLGGIPRATTKAMDMGTLSHALLLGAGKDIEVIDAADYKTKVAREKREAALKAGKHPALADDYEAAVKAATELRTRLWEKEIVLDGDREVVSFWTEQASNGAEVQCRGMIDHLKLPRIYDIKSTRSANPDVCRRHVENYGYSIQHAAYVSAIERIRPELAGRVEFIFVFYELEPPYEVTPVRLSGAFRELGDRAWRKAVDRWEECLRTNIWPGYASGIVDVEPSPWALSKALGAEERFA